MVNKTDGILGEPYRSWEDEGSRTHAMEHFHESLQSYNGVFRTAAFNRTDYSNLDTKVSGRPGLSWKDYDAFRPGEARPTKIHDILLAADNAYRDEGIVRNIIDLMGDFSCQGVRLVHPNKRIERFYRNWWKRVSGKERSERFLNYLYRTGNVVIRKQTARIPSRIEKDIFKSVADPDVQVKLKKVASKEIPWKYTFLHPATIVVVGGPLASFVGDKLYAMKLPASLRRLIKSPKTEAEKSIIAQLPAEIIEAAQTSTPILLPEDKTLVFHYKKDDWQEWALPMVYAIMEDLVTLKKLKLADRAALDGAISNIRVWKLGSLQHKIAPNPAAAARLSEILENNVGVGTMDLVWDDAIELLESKSTVHQFLGEEKYTPTMNNIYAGLGIPPTLTGTFGAAGTTNNFISLKTLTQRLEYGRGVLREFWEAELIEVQKAMGFRFPAKLEFDQTNLADEDAVKTLLIQLADRNLISDELLQEKFNIEPDMEKVRLNRELREREKGNMVPKSGPFHDPMFGVALKKIALQSGVVTPSQVGLRKEEVRRDLKMYDKEDGDTKNALEYRTPPASAGGTSTTKKKGPAGQGRPKNKKDSSPRKTPKFKPKSKAVLEIWAGAAQEAIAQYLHVDLLDFFNKKNMRSLSADQIKQAEEVKFGILFNLEPLGTISEEAIAQTLEAGLPAHVKDSYAEWTSGVSLEIGRTLNTEETRQLQAVLYAEYMGDD